MLKIDKSGVKIKTQRYVNKFTSTHQADDREAKGMP
jgi:hypothetical protein